MTKRKSKVSLLQSEKDIEHQLKETQSRMGRPPKPNRVRFNTMLDNDIKKRIQHIAIDRGGSVADLINEAVTQWLDKVKK